MKVMEVMSREPVTVTPDQDIREACQQMAQADCGFLPVGENDALVGMVTDRDIAVRGVAEGFGPDASVRDVMTQDVKYCFEDDECDAVARNMGGQQIRRLPVVDRDKRLVGIVSLGDLAARQSGTAAGSALENIAQPGGAHST